MSHLETLGVLTDRRLRGRQRRAGRGARGQRFAAPARVLLCSHDGYGLGHVRRNMLLADAVLATGPAVEVTVMTGVAADLPWLRPTGVEVLQMPPIRKGADGAYRGEGLSIEDAVGIRERLFRSAVARLRPDVVVIDRHPFGTAGELRRGLELAAAQGAAVVLGLRDVLDDPAVVRAELEGPRWDGVEGLFTDVLVYGSRALVDHEREYGLPLVPTYCGWVTSPASRSTRVERSLAIAAGGGADGDPVFRLGLELLRRRGGWSGVLAAGPYAGDVVSALSRELGGRLDVARNLDGCPELFSRAAAVIQMAGYNSTFEALASGLRPVLVPRRSPRREQAIRASRLAAWGLADVVDEGAGVDEVDWLLDQPRELAPGQLQRAGIHIDGAPFVARRLHALAAARRAA